MITITRNTTNKIVLSLSESATMSYFVFTFQPLRTLDEANDLIYYYTPDVSIYSNRYNQFDIIESDAGGTSSINNAPIYLLPGQYEYKAYQSATTSLTASIYSSPVEVGIMVVGSLTQYDSGTYIDDIYK